MNSVNLIGNLGKDPELRFTPSNKSVSTFDLAVSGYNNTTTWITIVAWGKTAELVCQYATKGSKLGVTGRLQVRTWEDKSGNKRRNMEVVADTVHFTGSKKEGYSERNEAPAEGGYDSGHSTLAQDSDFAQLDMDEGELPF